MTSAGADAAGAIVEANGGTDADLRAASEVVDGASAGTVAVPGDLAFTRDAAAAGVADRTLSNSSVGASANAARIASLGFGDSTCADAVHAASADDKILSHDATVAKVTIGDAVVAGDAIDASDACAGSGHDASSNVCASVGADVNVGGPFTANTDIAFGNATMAANTAASASDTGTEKTVVHAHDQAEVTEPLNVSVTGAEDCGVSCRHVSDLQQKGGGEEPTSGVIKNLGLPFPSPVCKAA